MTPTSPSKCHEPGASARGWDVFSHENAMTRSETDASRASAHGADRTVQCAANALARLLGARCFCPKRLLKCVFLRQLQTAHPGSNTSTWSCTRVRTVGEDTGPCADTSPFASPPAARAGAGGCGQAAPPTSVLTLLLPVAFLSFLVIKRTKAGRQVVG